MVGVGGRRDLQSGQHDLIETVIEHFPYVGPALVGSLLWLASMLLMGIRILISTPQETNHAYY